MNKEHLLMMKFMGKDREQVQHHIREGGGAEQSYNDN